MAINKGVIFVKIIGCHEIFADFPENIYFRPDSRENFRFNSRLNELNAAVYTVVRFV